MPTTRAYVIKLLLGTLYMALFLAIAPAILIGIFLILPQSIGGYFAAFMWKASEQFEQRVIYTVMGSLLAFALFMFFRFMVKAVSSVQPAQQKRKYYVATILYMVVMACGFVISGIAIFGEDYRRCDFYNSPDTLGAGIKTFNGKSYEIQVCGTAPRPQDGDDDKLELKVLSQEGELLAKRHYSVNWEAGRSFHEPLQYEVNAITILNAYGDDMKIQIPPTKLDWIRARIPLLD